MRYANTFVKTLVISLAALSIAAATTMQYANAAIEHQLPLDIQYGNDRVVVSGTIPQHCNDLRVELKPDAANTWMYYSSGSDFNINSDGSWSQDITQAAYTLNNGVHNINLYSKCGAASYDNPNYADRYIDALSIVPEACDDNCVSVHRFYNYSSGAHFYTSNEYEKRLLLERRNEFRYERIGTFAKGSMDTGLVPVFRFYNLKLDVHFYTVDSNEAANVRATLSQTYRDEGIAYYTYPTKQPNNVPVFRFYNLQKGVHFYTNDTNEAAHIRATASGTLRDEGTSFFNIANVN